MRSGGTTTDVCPVLGFHNSSAAGEIVGAMASWKGHPIWQVEAQQARTWLENEVTRMTVDPMRVENRIEEQILSEYRDAMRGSVEKSYTSLSEYLRDWRSGEEIERFWRSFHGANQTLLVLQGEAAVRARIPEIGSALAAALRSDDPRLGAYKKRLAALQSAPGAELEAARTELRTMLATADSTSDTAHADIRSWRNLLAMVGAFVTILMLIVALLHAIHPSFLSLTAQIPNAGETPEVWEIELFGLIGGALSAVVALIRIQGFAGAYRLPVYQAAFRLPVGVATGLVAVILLQGALFHAVSPQKGSALAAYAVLFGFSQELVLQFLDRKAAQLIGAARTQNDPQTKPASPAVQ